MNKHHAQAGEYCRLVIADVSPDRKKNEFAQLLVLRRTGRIKEGYLLYYNASWLPFAAYR